MWVFFISTDQNPSDYGTRCLQASALKDSALLCENIRHSFESTLKREDVTDEELITISSGLKKIGS